MRKSIVATATTIVTVIALTASSVAWAEALAPGKPAGVHAAQMGNKEWLVFGGVGVVVAAVVIANAGSGDHAATTSQPTSVITTTTTS